MPRRRSGQRQNLESRAKKIACCNRTLTFILSLTGRGDRIQAVAALSTSLKRLIRLARSSGCP